MGIYRILWRIVVGVLTVGGASLAFLYVPWGFLISISVCALILGPLIGDGIGPTLRSSIITAALAPGATANTVPQPPTTSPVDPAGSSRPWLFAGSPRSGWTSPPPQFG